MWKVLQSVPRGLRAGLACHARRNAHREEDQDNAVCLASLPALNTRHYSGGNDRGQQSSDDQRFRVNSDTWKYVGQRHSLLEALGWGVALTAGIVATRPSLASRPVLSTRDDQSRESQTSLLLDFAASMPINGSPGQPCVEERGACGQPCVEERGASGQSRVEERGATQSVPAARTKVNRSDSGFSEAQTASRDQSVSLVEPRRLWESESTSDSYDSDTECSWDSSASFQSSSSSSSSSSLDPFKFRISAQSSGGENSDRSWFKTSSSSSQKTRKKSTSAVKDEENKDEIRYIVNEPKDNILPECSSFSEAVNQFEDICRQVYGRHCNHCAIRALKKADGLWAVHHWMRASRAGYDKGQYNLGRCYEEGIGTYRDLEKAKYYYSLAAAQGHLAARRRLHQMVTTETSARLFYRLSSAEQGLKCRGQKSRSWIT